MPALKRSATALVAVLLLSAAAYSQTATFSITVSPPPPSPFTVPVSQQVILNGVTYNLTGTLTLTPAPAGTVTPPPAAGSAITKVTDSTGAAITNTPAGGTLVVVGSGLGSFGTATVAGLPAQVLTWTPTQVTLKAPTTGSAAGTASGPVVLKAGDAAPATSAASVTVTGLTAELPPGDGPTWESPVIAVSQTLDDPPTNPDPFAGYEPEDEPDQDLPEPDPVVFAVMDDTNVPVPPPYDYAEPFIFVGDWFGDLPGRVEINDQAATVVSWSNTSITARSLQQGTTDRIGVLVQTVDARYYLGAIPTD